MADVGIEQLKEDIQADIKANNNQTITGDLLQERLIDTVDTLKGYTDDHVSVSQNTLTQGKDLKAGDKTLIGSLVGIGIYDGIYYDVQTETSFYEGCLKELYIKPEYASQVDWIDFRSYFSIWLCGFSGDFTTTPPLESAKILVAGQSLDGIQNGDIVPLIASTTTSVVQQGDIIGYVIFKDVNSFRNKGTGSYGNTLNIPFVKQIQNSPTILLSSVNDNIDDIEDNIDDIEDNIKEINTYLDGHIYDGIIHEIGVSEPSFYESCIQELYIKPELVSQVDWIDFRSYFAIWMVAWVGDFPQGSAPNLLPISGQSLLWNSNGEVIPLIASATTTLVNKGDVIGYVVFKDIVSFRSKGTGSLGNTLNLNWVNRLSNCPIISNYIFNKGEESLSITIPSVVYAIVGTELNMYNDNVSLSADKGLMSPINYQVRWSCDKGYVTKRGFRFTPTADDVGDHTCTCELYNLYDELISAKTFTIRVKAKDALTSAKKIVHFGDSIGYDTAVKLYDNFHNTEHQSGTSPTMYGLVGYTIKCECYGGWRWEDFATSGQPAFRFYVSGVSSLSIGAVYTNNGHSYTIREINVTEGSGNILCQCDYASDTPTASGTLTKQSGAGDDTITFSSNSANSANPLWNYDESKIDIALYKTRLGLSSSDKFDAVSFQLGLNGASDSELANAETYIKALYNAFIADNADCKFILGLTTSGQNDADGFGANYGATGNYFGMLKGYYKYRKLYLSLMNDSSMPNLRIATPNLSIDRYYGYPMAERAISARYPTDEVYHTNFVHPDTSGYYQIADAYLAAYVAILSE